MGVSTQQRSAKWTQRRREIVDLSAKVFAERGFHGTSTVELCDANGLGKGALYYYISSKEELLAAIHDRVMDEVMAGADRVAATGGSPTHQLKAHGEALIDVITRYPHHVWVFLHEFPALTGDNARQFRARRRAYEDRIEAVLRGGVETGEFAPMDPALTARAWLGMHNYTYLWLDPRGSISPAEVAARFAEVFVSGIAA